MAATVRIHRTDVGYSLDEPGSFLGSGFFIAPNWVLTCAHVVRGGEGGEMAVVYEGGPGRGGSTVPAEVVATLPDHVDDTAPGNWPAPDLALVQLRAPVDHACVYVSERPAAYYAEGKVFYAGWTVLGGRLQLLDGTLTVQGTIGGWSEGVQMRLGHNDLPYGVSGGPVVDPARGEVIGVLKSRADHGSGGTSTGIEQLRRLPVPEEGVQAEHEDHYQAIFHAHDRYHRDRQQSDSGGPSWADVQSRLDARPGRTLTPGERIQLLGRLADLPPPVSTRGLLDVLESLPDLQATTPLPAPRAWRDGLGALYENARDDGAWGLVLEYAVRVAYAERPFDRPGTADAETALWDWARQARGGQIPLRRLVRLRADLLRLRRRPTAAPAGPLPRRGPRSVALLELVERGWERERWDWRVSVTRPGGAVEGVGEGERTATGELPSRLASPLAEAFRQCDERGRPAVLQVALPHTRLDLPVDTWQLDPDEPPLGARGPLVLRCVDRDRLPSEDADGLSPWTDPDEDRFDRWRWLRAHGARAYVLDCGDGVPQQVPDVDVLRDLSPESVPVLCRYGEDRYEDDVAALARIVLGGFGVALWRRGRDRRDAVCGEFHRGAAITVADERGAEHLPERVHELRASLLASRTEAFWAHGITLFYDDPLQPLPGTGDLLEAP
ncbi:trypsin-like peptidase domain-containing protein [Streptomyces sp. NPDC057403]|uniref:VMAP-C domain-containing protein n=1 Tax=Streptomyces sp. NPDC057403 TaxID=3346119 RepID=UPI0036BF8C04